MPHSCISISTVCLPALILLSHLDCSIFPPVLSHYSVTMRYMVYYIIALGFYSAVWYTFSILIQCFHFLTFGSRSARLSLLFMVIRITPPYHAGTLRALHFLAWGFGVAWGILIAQTIWVCEKKTTWKVRAFCSNLRTFPHSTGIQMTPAPQCPLGVSVPIAQLISMAPLRSRFPAAFFS